MIRLFRRWWRKVVRWVGRLMGSDGAALRNKTPQAAEAEMTRAEMKTLSDRAYESLYLSLLDLSLPEQTEAETKASEEQISAQLGKRGNDKSFVSWLKRFGRERLKRPSEHRDLAERMVAFGSLGLGQVSDMSRELGEQLLEQANKEPVEEKSDDGGVQAEQELGDAEDSRSEEDEKRVEFYFQQGSEAYFRGDFAGAIAAYNQALKINTHIYEVLYNKGVCLHKLEEYGEAIAVYEKALITKLNTHEVLYNKGLSLYELGRRREAIDTHIKALTIAACSQDVSRPCLLTFLAQYDETIASHSRALTIKFDI